MVDSLFKYNIDYLNETYCIIRDEERLKDYKSYIESLWQIYCPYSDKDFPIELAHDFDARFREMYLTCTLISKSFPVVPKKGISEGPDIATVDSTRKVFIEAVTCDEGAPTNRDRVPKLPVYDINTLGIAKASIIPENEILLRYTGKIFDKYKKGILTT